MLAVVSGGFHFTPMFSVVSQDLYTWMVSGVIANIFPTYVSVEVLQKYPWEGNIDHNSTMPLFNFSLIPSPPLTGRTLA